MANYFLYPCHNHSGNLPFGPGGPGGPIKPSPWFQPSRSETGKTKKIKLLNNLDASEM